MNKIFSSLAKLDETGKSAVLCIITKSQGSTPRKGGSKLLVLDDGTTEGTVGGGRIEFLVIEEARKMLNSGLTKTIDYDLDGDVGMQCGGKMSIYFEAINSAPRLLIFGGGHIGRVLAEMALPYHFNVHIIDNREEVFRNLKEGIHTIHGAFPQAYENIEYRESDFVVVTTYKHTYDEEIVAHILQQPHTYLGMMASKRKAALARKKWEERGIDKEKIIHVFSPIGISILCETPEEIALSVMGQLVDELNKTKKK
jgi:xanthine dehydrogenase accessory factor